MLPEIVFDFNFDYVIIILFLSYSLYGYFSGGHKQIRISINLILPFVVIYYLGGFITSYIYEPLSKTVFFDFLYHVTPFVPNTATMMFAYFIAYIMVLVVIFILSIVMKRRVLNENMRAKLGKWNNYLGVGFSLLNGYVLVYFLVLPMFALGAIDNEANVTNFLMEHPPTFSRVARTAEAAVPIKSFTDTALEFEELISVEGLSDYYEDALYYYQDKYIGEDGLEGDFMTEVYPYLSNENKNRLDTAFFDYYGHSIDSSDTGVSRILLQKDSTGVYLYNELHRNQVEFENTISEAKNIVAAYEAYEAAYEVWLEQTDEVAEYESDVLLYNELYEMYQTDLTVYLDSLVAYEGRKLDALISGNSFSEVFDEERPTFTFQRPSEPEFVADGSYSETNTLVEPDEDAYQDALNLLGDVDEVDKMVSSMILEYGDEFRIYEGLIVWYVDEFDGVIPSSNGDMSQISVVLNSYKNNYDEISAAIQDEELLEKLRLTYMSVTIYDVFTSWLACVEHNINDENVTIDDLSQESNLCGDFNINGNEEYDLLNNAIGISTFLLKDDNISWVITQFKYDYEAGSFASVFEDFPEVLEVLERTYDFAIEYEEKYKDIAVSLDGDISMVFKIGISVAKYNLDVYDMLDQSPIVAAIANDGAMICTSSVESDIDRNITVCQSGFTYLASEIVVKAYLIVDENNEPIIYDSLKMEELLQKIDKGIEDGVFTEDVVKTIADQIAFHVVDEETNQTLLDFLYTEGYFSVEAMKILVEDEHGLFSDYFRARCSNLAR